MEKTTFLFYRLTSITISSRSLVAVTTSRNRDAAIPSVRVPFAAGTASQASFPKAASGPTHTGRQQDRAQSPFCSARSGWKGTVLLGESGQKAAGAAALPGAAASGRTFAQSHRAIRLTGFFLIIWVELVERFHLQ